MSKITQIINKIEAEHPYKIKGKQDTYSEYNDAWADCCARFEVELGNVEQERRESEYHNC